MKTSLKFNPQIEVQDDDFHPPELRDRALEKCRLVRSYCDIFTLVMKFNKTLLLTILLLSTKIHAQVITIEQVEAYSNELVKNGFLTSKGKAVLLREIANENIEVDHRSTVKSITYSSSKVSKESILQFCSAALTTELMNRLNGKGREVEEMICPKEPLDDSSGRTYSVMDGLGGKKEYMGCITTQISVFGYTRMKTLTTFLKSGLIDEKVFNDCLNALKSKRLRDEVELLRYMVYRSTYYRYYEFNKKEQEDYITSLVKHGILSEAGKAILLNSYKDYELKTIPEILEQSSRYVLVDLHSYEPDPKVTYPVVFEAVRKLLPEFKYSGLSISVRGERERDLIRENVNLTFKIDTLHYSHTFFHDYKRVKPTPNDPVLEPSRVDQDFHKGINKWLTDIESQFRLYTINILDEDETAYGRRSVGLLLLKEGEDSLITTDVYTISRESFDNRLSKKNIKKLLTELSQNGFFKHLTQAEINTAEEKIATSEINSIEDVLLQFPKTIVVFDWETGNLENPYENLTKEFMAASRGAFNVSDIIDEFKKGWNKAKRIRYGFTMNGKRYEKMLKFETDWLDPDFMELIKSALLEHKIDGHIYHCVDDGQVGGYVFLSFDQYKFIQQFYPDLLKGD